MERYPDWPQRLAAAIAGKRSIPHTWGENDCALCAADLVLAQTGQDFAAGFRGLYRDEDGANAVLAELGIERLDGLVDALLPRREGRPQRGDVSLIAGERGAFLATHWSGALVAPGPDGLLIWRPSNILVSWGVA
jgi:hypothetical protein